MARMARVVVPGLPHHVTQRGVRSLNIFRDDPDRRVYLRLLADHGERQGLSFLAWCLMPNHVHMIVVPETEGALSRTIGEAHRVYAQTLNRREDVRGHLFQYRFWSCVLDEPHLLASARYIELNPVTAHITDHASEYEWSSAPFHLGRKKKDPLVEDRSLLGLVADWREFLEAGLESDDAPAIEKHLSTGRPLGSEAFVTDIEQRLGRRLRPLKRGWRKGQKRK